MTRQSPAIGIKLPKTHDQPQVPSPMELETFGRTAERLGYESIWTTESWGNDPFVELTKLADVTEDVRLGTAIINVFTRSPVVIAQGAATLARRSDERAVLGLGTGHPHKISEIHEIEFERPIGRTGDVVKRVDELTGSSDAGKGAVFSPDHLPAQSVDVPVYNAALGQQNRRLTGALADGWLPFFVPFSRLERAFEPIADAARERERDPGEIDVVPQVIAAVADEATVAYDVVSQYIAGFVGGYDDDIFETAVGTRFPDEVDKITAAWGLEDERAASHVSREMVQELGVAGTPTAARQQLSDLVNHPIVDVPMVYVPFSAPDRMTERTISELAPAEL